MDMNSKVSTAWYEMAGYKNKKYTSYFVEQSNNNWISFQTTIETKNLRHTHLVILQVTTNKGIKRLKTTRN
jgi:hypothetical protein